MTEHIQRRFTHSFTGLLLAEALLCARPWEEPWPWLAAALRAGGQRAGPLPSMPARHVSRRPFGEAVKAGIVCGGENN